MAPFVLTNEERDDLERMFHDRRFTDLEFIPWISDNRTIEIIFSAPGQGTFDDIGPDKFPELEDTRHSGAIWRGIDDRYLMRYLKLR